MRHPGFAFPRFLRSLTHQLDASKNSRLSGLLIRSRFQSRRRIGIERVRRILRRFSELGDIKPPIELKPLEDNEKFATIVEDCTRELVALDRYERRAISKRKSAIRGFDSG